MCVLLMLDCFYVLGRREIVWIDFCNKMIVMVVSFICLLVWVKKEIMLVFLFLLVLIKKKYFYVW